MSSPERPEAPDGGRRPEDTETELEDAARLEAEADYAAEHNPPSGTATGPTAADEGEIQAPGAPDTAESTATTVAESGSAAPPSAEPDAPTTGGVQPETPAAEMLAGTRPIPKPAPKPAPDAAAPEQPAAAPAPTPSVADEPVEVAPGGDGATPEAVPSAEVHAEPSQTEVPAPEAPPAAEAPTAEEPAEAEARPAPEEPEAAEPVEPLFDEKRTPLLEALQQHLGEAVVEVAVIPGPDAVARVRVDAWHQVLEVCRDQLGLTYFCFLSGMDWMPSPYGKSEESGLRRADDIPDPVNGPFQTGAGGGETRFQVFARLEKPTADLGLTIKADVGDDLTVDTVHDLFAGAEWHEREVAEMFGIDFRGHPNPIHIYLPGEFEGFPLRKDYPLLAREVKPWPGLVDVEPMPGEEAEPTEAAEEEEVTA